jgi:hypothetical protein
MIRTFLDAGVLIWYTRTSDEPRYNVARDILIDPNRSFLTSPFLAAELIPHATRSGKRHELQALEEYFRLCTPVTDLPAILATAEQVLRKRLMG